MRISLAAILVVALGAPVHADDGVFSVVTPSEGASEVRFATDVGALRALLAAVPAFRPDAAMGDYAAPIVLPEPDGGMVACRVAESSVMEPPLQARFPQIRTYVVQTADRTGVGRLELTPRGLTGMIRTPRGTWMIDPADPRRPGMARAYWLHDAAASFDWVCQTHEGAPPLHGFATEPTEVELPPLADRGPSPKVLRTVRLAMACTGEYGLHECQWLGHEPNVVDPLAAIVTVVSRTNVVYEGDLGVHLVLVANNDRIVYIDPATDPYPSSCDGSGGADCSGSYLNPNTTTLSTQIGVANFDVGHLLTRVAGGVAYLSSVCTNNKAGGISGVPRGGDVHDLAFLVAVHELGHQFGASHTFSGTRGRCAGNVTLSSAWEAGTGSSPMGYPGGCPVGDAAPSDNIVQFADPYFHHGSVSQINTFLRTATCPAEQVSSNTPPAFSFISPSVVIPPGTAFELAAVAADADGDVLTYSWEEFDAGVARPISGDVPADNGQGALFRIFPPRRASSRTFPRMEDVLAGVSTPGERLPTFAGATRRFRCIVRDNHPGVGASVVSAFTDLTIAPGASPFMVTSPMAGAMLSPGANMITWSVGNTDAAPISCGTVTLLLSDDDGLSFGQVLGTFANAGTAVVSLPQGIAAARVRISGDGSVFFAVSPRFEVLFCAGDFNRSRSVSVQDILEFLSAWFALDSRADVNGSGDVTVQDIFDFLAAWFAPCG